MCYTPSKASILTNNFIPLLPANTRLFFIMNAPATFRAERLLHIVEKTWLTPHMIRIVLGGAELSTFPTDMAGGYVKLYFPSDNIKPLIRSYTVRFFDADTLQLTLDFAAHGDNGPASAWALQAEVGDQIMTNGPGAVALVDPNAEWVFIVGDMSALPALSVNIESLPETAIGYAVIEVTSENDQQVLNVPAGIETEWVINSHPEQCNTLLSDAVKAKQWLSGQPSVWLASEFDTMRNLRRYFKQERNVPKDAIYASSYWKIGTTDEGNKAAKKLDVEVDS